MESINPRCPVHGVRHSRPICDLDEVPSTPKRLTPEVIEGLRRDNEEAKKSGWKANIGVDDLDLLLDAVTNKEI